MSDKPNFLLIVTDQHRANYLGCYGHPFLKTPNIDNIARHGTRFEKFYVTNPVCMPNRASMMTGRMTTAHGVRHNGLALCPTSNTFVELLRDAGYRTSLVGKSHLQPYSRFEPMLKRPEPRPGFHEPRKALQDARKPFPGFPGTDQELPSSWEDDPEFLDLPFYGFEKARIATSHGDRVGGHYKHWLRDRHPDPEGLVGPQNALEHDYICPQAWRTAVPEELYPTSFVADTSVAFLQEHKTTTPNTPFFLMASFPDPHHPFTPPGKYWDMYNPDDVELPADWADMSENLPPHLQWLYDRSAEGNENRSGQFAFCVNEREAREAIALTCGMISMVDDAVGRILAELERLGLRENTVVIFTSDHGDLMGDHRLMLKGPLHYDGVIRVPMIWADLGDAAQIPVTRELGSTIDIAGSILERARIEPYTGFQGRSLLGTVHGERGPRRSILIEDDSQRQALGFDQPVRCRTVVTETHRLTIYQGATWGELYDLVNDPRERVNLWSAHEHAATRHQLMEELARLQMEMADRSPLPTALA